MEEDSPQTPSTSSSSSPSWPSLSMSTDSEDPEMLYEDAIIESICHHLEYSDLKTFRLANKLCMANSLKHFVARTRLNTNVGLIDVNRNYDNSNLKDVTAAKFEGKINLPAFRLFFEKWLHVTDIQIIISERDYSVPVAIPTSCFPRVEKLYAKGMVKFVLDKPITLVELTMDDAAFTTHATNLLPYQWHRYSQLKISGLRKLRISSPIMQLNFNINNFLQLESLEMEAKMGSGDVSGWHDGLMVRRIYFSRIEVNLMQLPPCVKICHFKVCWFHSCIPKMLNVEEIRNEYGEFDSKTYHQIVRSMFHVNLSHCKELHTLCIDWSQLNTSNLPSHLRYIRLRLGCEINGRIVDVDTLSISCIYSNSNSQFNSFEGLDAMLEKFEYRVLHVDVDIGNSLFREFIESDTFANLISIHSDRTLYLSADNYSMSTDPEAFLRSRFSTLVDSLSDYYEFQGGIGTTISKTSFYKKVRFWTPWR